MYIRSCYMTLYRYTFQSGNEDSDLSTTHLRDFWGGLFVDIIHCLLYHPEYLVIPPTSVNNVPHSCWRTANLLTTGQGCRSETIRGETWDGGDGNVYASRRSRTRDTVKLTVTAQRFQCDENQQASSYVLLDFDLWICKLKLCSWVTAGFTYSEGCCSLFRTVPCIICSHKVSIKVMS